MFTLQKNILQIIFTILFSISTFSSLSYAGHQEVGDAVRAIVRGNPTPEQEMIGFVNNTEINLMGVNAQEGQGGITKEIYNAYQRWFHDLNAKFVENAVKKAGFQTELPEYSSLNPGTDTDVPVNAPKGQQITVEDIEKIEKLHLKEIEKYFKKKGVELNGEPDIETDFMGNPDQMTTSEFRKMAYHINHERGGTAYEDPLAAKAQLKLQSGKTPTLEESAAYNREMRRLSTKKLKHGANLREEASEALEEGNLDKARRLTSEARLNEYQAGKYVQRYRACDNALRKRFGLEPKEPTALEGDFETIAAEGRGSGRSAEALNNSRLRIQRINEIIAEDNLETLAHIAEKYPNLAKTAAKAAIENVEAMPADQAKTILKKIQNVKSPDFKVTISEHFREPSILEKDIAAPTFKVLRVTMVAGMAVLAGNAGVEYTLRHDVDPTDTDLTFIAKSIKNSLWYGSGLGFSADEAIKDQLELYRRALQHGEDPSLLKHMTLMYLRTATYMGRDAVVGLMLLPDTVVEYFTEEKKWKQYTKAQDELASIIHKIVLSKKAFKKVLQQLKKYNIHSEDEIAVLNCLCRDCGGSLGGIFRPEFVGPGYGPCQCNGPLSIWKTAVPTGNKRILNCVNQSALYNGLKNQKIFDQWHNRLNEINAKSVDKEVEEIEKNIAKKDFIAAAKIFKHIEPFIHNRMVKRTYNGKVQGENESYRLHGEIINGLSDQARKEAKDYQDDSLKKAVKNMESATDLDKRYQKRLDKYKKWQRGWDKVVNQELPDIHTRLHDNDIPTAETALINIHDKINRQLLPPRHNDPKIKLADEMLRKKRIEYGAELKKMSQRFFWLKSHSDPRKAVKTETAFFEKWKNQAVDQNNFEREKVKCLQAIKLAQENDKAGDAALSSHNTSLAVDHYRTSLRLQKDQKVLDKLNALLKQINIGTDLLKKAREEWKLGNLQEAINIAREADRNNPHDNAISRTLKAMQNQKKQMDDALVKAGKLIEQKKLKKAESVLKKAARINTKYLPYVKMLKKLDGARSVLKKVKHIGNNYKPYIKMVKNMKYAKNKVPRPPKPRNLSYAKSFAGKWNSTYGVMKLTVQGLHVSGNYTHDKGRIEAVLSQDGKTMKGTWAEAPSYRGSTDAGKMYFKLSNDAKKIDGLWSYGDAEPTHSWTATRIVDTQPSTKNSSKHKSPKETKSSKNKISGDIASLVGSWSFGRSQHYGKPVHEHLCDLVLTDNLVKGKGYKIDSCNSNESYWMLEGKSLLFIGLDGTVTTRFTEVKPGYWRGTYVGSAHTSEGVVHYLKKSDEWASKIKSDNISKTVAKTKMSTTYAPNNKGDAFKGGHWAGANGGSDWLQKDFASPQYVTGIYIAEASTDITTEGFKLVLKLRKPNGEWITIDELHDTNINRTALSGGGIGKSVPSYSKHLSFPIEASSFRLEFYGHGWFDATDIRIYTGKKDDEHNKKLAEKIRKLKEKAKKEAFKEKIRKLREEARKEALAEKIKKLRDEAKREALAKKIQKLREEAKSDSKLVLSPATTHISTHTSGNYIKIISATYGANCGVAKGNVTNYIAKQCNGRSRCRYVVDYKKIGDPAYGCKKIYSVQFKCGNDSHIYKESLGAEAGWGDKSVLLDCQKISAQDAIGREQVRSGMEPSTKITANEKNTRRIITIRNPKVNGIALDYCREWAQNCGKPAADDWCQMNGYSESVSYILKRGTPPTRIISTGKICDKSYCGRIVEIKCRYKISNKEKIKTKDIGNPTGEWNTSEGHMLLQKDGYKLYGTYSQDQGKISGTINGNVFDGYWSETDAGKQCATSFQGRVYWGRVIFTFTKDTFNGEWGYCNDEPNHNWHGSRTKK